VASAAGAKELTTVATLDALGAGDDLEDVKLE
jgi:hypothetical protein